MHVLTALKQFFKRGRVTRAKCTCNAVLHVGWEGGGTVLLSSETGVEGPGRIQNFKPFPNAMVR